jgi:uncharacterized protein YggT (Ycf19 family)
LIVYPFFECRKEKNFSELLAPGCKPFYTPVRFKRRRMPPPDPTI